MAKMQAGNKPGMQQLADSLVLSGEGNTVALQFSIPSEVLDVLEGLAKGRHPQLAAALNGLSASSRAKWVISAAWATTSSSTAR